MMAVMTRSGSKVGVWRQWGFSGGVMMMLMMVVGCSWWWYDCRGGCGGVGGWWRRVFGKKLSNLERNDLFDLNVALRMFTRRVVILKRVEDLQLGVESYQKKLNLTRPETFRSDISKMTLYTAYNNPQGIIYQDKFKGNRLMRFDELYKFWHTLISLKGSS
ncbi:hypothetical protein Tco_0625017 [Tanacetum coccineum]|uniref:Uncharacterized protein n=1 Tax=Tanacetum coccineum TaxID=301880 RepID=A0ABQ4WFQ0_9ASTR